MTYFLNVLLELIRIFYLLLYLISKKEVSKKQKNGLKIVIIYVKKFTISLIINGL